MGEGAGADICAAFAIIHPDRCMGLCLIRPNGSIATLNEQLSYLSNGFDNDKIEPIMISYISFHRYEKKSDKSKWIYLFLILN